jgi:hypothetical protein
MMGLPLSGTRDLERKNWIGFGPMVEFSSLCLQSRSLSNFKVKQRKWLGRSGHMTSHHHAVKLPSIRSFRNIRRNRLPNSTSILDFGAAVHTKLLHSLPHPPWSLQVELLSVSDIIHHAESLLNMFQVRNIYEADSWLSNPVHSCNVQFGILGKGLPISGQKLAGVSSVSRQTEMNVRYKWGGNVCHKYHRHNSR